MSSENPSGADNQQETERKLTLDPQYVCGFVDGEGCFSVSIHRNAGAPWGWQLMPVFHAYQHAKGRAVLEALQDTFGCGYVRSKGAGSDILSFQVQARSQLISSVLPFFEHYPLHIKQRDFESFATIVRSLEAKQHCSRAGFERVVRLAYGMNMLGKQRKRSIEEILGGSSETIRQAPPSGG